MAQTQAPANFWKNGHMRGYTPSGATYPGDIVVIGSKAFLAANAIAANALGTLHVDGTWQIPKDTSTFADGDAVYWNATGNPNIGTAGTGAATSTASGNTYIGTADGSAATGDQYVYALTVPVMNVASVGGVMTATSITASTSTLPIAGVAAAQGGSVSITGGASSTSGNAGGAASMAGGLGGATGTGGAASVTGGAGTSTGLGGAATLTGGAGGNATSGTGAVGGAATVTAGAGGTATTGTGGAGAVASLVSGAGGAASGAAGVGGAGGASNLAAGVGGASALSTGGAGGLMTVAGGVGGAATGGSGNGGAGGNLILNSGTGGTSSGGSAGANGVVAIGDLASSCAGIYLGRGTKSALQVAVTTTSIGTSQSSTPTSAQLLGGIVTQTGATGAGTVTLPTGTALSTACPRTPVAGDSFDCWFCNLGGSQTLTITGQTGTTVIGTAAVGTGKMSIIKFVNTGSNAWNCYVSVSA